MKKNRIKTSLKYLLFLFVLQLFLHSCGPKRALVSQGTSKRHSKRDHRNNMNTRSRGASKAPQMGFYYQRQSQNVFKATAFKIRYITAPKNVKHKLGNDQRATSQANNNRQNKKSEGNVKAFINKQGSVPTKNNLGFDNTKDSFSKNPNKREKPRSGIHKKYR